MTKSLKFRCKGQKKAFVSYEGVYIRKSITLYTCQENARLSNDHLLRVRKTQPGRLFNNDGDVENQLNCLKCGDHCIFKIIDAKKYITVFVHER